MKKEGQFNENLLYLILGVIFLTLLVMAIMRWSYFK
jgi:hypothetical protein